jgi:plastocyanin
MRVLAVPSVVIALAVAGCGSTSGDKAPAAQKATTPSTSTAAGPPVRMATVDIDSFKYKPVTVSVRKGGRVRWTNSDAAAHTATADDRSFDTQTIDKGAARMVTFTTAGTFAYHCDFHPFMKATVVVK